MMNKIDDIANLIIRPSRYLYKNIDLGAKSFVVNNKNVIRTDFQVKNQKNQTIKGSIYSNTDIGSMQNILIYLHCNSGCRIQGNYGDKVGLTYLKLAVEHDFSYLVFDFTGSGASQGKYVTLGYYEVDDLDTVINYVLGITQQRAKIALWGRSMGAVTALRYIEKHNCIETAVFDSPFLSLKSLFTQIGKQKTNFPEIVLQVAYKYLKPVIQQRAGFDIDELNLEYLINNSSCTGIFLASKQDSLVPFNHIDQIFNNYKGAKQMFFIEQSHNEPRDIRVIKKVFKTIFQQLKTSNLTNNNKPILRKNKNNKYFSSISNNQKQGSRKKLQLTIKSHSHRLLTVFNNKNIPINTPNKKNLQESKQQTQILEKKQISCLLPHKKYAKGLLELQQNQDIKIKDKNNFEIRRHPFKMKNFFNESNNKPNSTENLIKFKPNFLAQKKPIAANLINIFDQTNITRQRKTLQHITSKKPPLVEVKVKDCRKSLDVNHNYRTQLR